MTPNTGSKALFSLVVSGVLLFALISVEYLRHRGEAVQAAAGSSVRRMSTAPPVLIADFEQGHPASPWGSWKAIDDRGVSGISTSEIAVVDQGADSTGHALRIWGSSEIWYFPFPFAGVAAPLGKLEFGTPVPRDVSGYTGLEFWARGDDHDYMVSVVSDEVTDWNHHHAVFRLPKAWTHYQIPFSDLRQFSWGKQLPWTGHQVSQLHFVTYSGAGKAPGKFEFWLDQVRLY